MDLGFEQGKDLLEGVHGGEMPANGMSEQAASALGNYVTRIFERNKAHRISCGIEEELTECLHQANSRYPAAELEKIKAIGVRPVYFPYTAVKINAAQAWISEIFLNTTEKTYVLRPTPLPELEPNETKLIVQECLREWMENRGGLPETPDDRITLFFYILNRRDELHNKVQDAARERAANMERLINDQFLEGGWKDALSDLIEDISTYGTGVLKGPEMRMRKRVRYDKDANGETTCVVDWKQVPEWRHLDPFDCYPSPGAVDINDGPFCHKVRLLPKDLAAMRGVPGYRDDVIDSLIQRYPNGGLSLNTNSDSLIRENRNDGGSADTIFLEGFEFWGECNGGDLLNWGVITDMEGNPLDENKFYEVNTLVFGGEAVYCALVDERLGRPFYKGVFYSTVGSWWGYGPARIMRDIQHEMNAAKRNLVYNMAMASGPIKVINNINALQNPQDAAVTIPWQTIVCKQSLGMPTNGRPIVEFLVTPSIMNELSNELEVCMKHADTVTGIPAYSHGSNVAAGAGRALADYERVWTPSGPIPICELNPGDEVLNTYGGVSRVTNVYPQGERDIVRLTFSNGDHVDCDFEHRWTVSDHPERDNSWKTFTVRELLDAGLFRETKADDRNPKGYRPKWALPKIDAVYFPSQEVTIDPYTMGVLLGDGDSRCRVTTGDEDIFDRIPYELGVEERYDICGACLTRCVKGVKAYYRALGLDCLTTEKFIPKEYLYNDYETRINLLRGLMDTDGCASKNGDHVFYSTSSKRLRDDFITLVKSLGATNVSVRTNEASTGEIRGKTIQRGENYRILFNLDHERVFYVERKQERVHKRKQRRIYITGAEYIGTHTATCITVDAKDSLFLCENFIPTHNTAQGLAMLMDAAQRGIKHVIFSLDKDVMRPSVTYMYRLNLLTHDDPSVKGDCEIDAGGLLAIISRDKNLNLIKEFLVLAQDPAKAQVMGEEGVAALMREYARLLQYVNVDDIVPTKEQIEARKQAQMQEQMMMAQMQGQQQGGGAPQMPGAPAPMAGLPPAMGANPDPTRMTEFQPNGVQATMTEGPM